MKRLLYLWLGVLFVYLLFAGRGTWQFHTTERNFFSLQAYSWLHGHIDLVKLPKETTDLSFYNNKVYFYYPPLSTVFALPFVGPFGVGVSDVFYTAFWASTAPVLLFLVLQKARKSKIIPHISDSTVLLLTLFFAFGTVFFYLSVLGTVWFTSQIISMIPLIASLYFLFNYVLTQKSVHYYISLILIVLSSWSRTELILMLLIPVGTMFYIKPRDKNKLIFIAVIIFFFNLILFGLYNQIRFHSWFETGLTYIHNDPRFIEQKKIGFFNFNYFDHNIFYFLLNPLGLKMTFPFIVPNPEGNSILFTSPLFILLVGIISKNLYSRKNFFLWLTLFTSLIIISAFLFYGSTGWFQFGYRYALDVIPLLILALAWVIEEYPKSFVYFLFLLSVIINTLGVIWMIELTPLLKY